MSLVSIFFISLFAVSCGILTYKKLFNYILIVYMLLFYSVFTLFNFRGLKTDLLYDGISIFFFLLIFFVFILRRNIDSNYKKNTLLIFSWTISSRCLGFPDTLDFGEKLGYLFAIGIFNIVFSFWFLFLFLHQKLFQKIFFVFFSIFQIVLFYLFSFSLESNFMSLIAIPFIYIGLCISLLASPLAFIFAYLGEIILFIIVLYQAFPKNPKNHSKDSNPQPHSPKDS